MGLTTKRTQKVEMTHVHNTVIVVTLICTLINKPLSYRMCVCMCVCVRVCVCVCVCATTHCVCLTVGVNIGRGPLGNGLHVHGRRDDEVLLLATGCLIGRSIASTWKKLIRWKRHTFMCPGVGYAM